MKKYILINEQVKRNLLSEIEAIDTSIDPKMTVEIKQHKKTRTGLQNAYYFGVVLKTISEYTGNTVEELHEIFKDKFLPKMEFEGFGVKKEVPVSTTKLNTHEFADYVDNILMLVSEYGLYIPSPGEQGYYES